MTFFSLVALSISFLIAGAVHPVGDIPVCHWHSMERSPEPASLMKATLNVAEDQAAGNWNLAGLYRPQ